MKVVLVGELRGGGGGRKQHETIEVRVWKEFRSEENCGGGRSRKKQQEAIEGNVRKGSLLVERELRGGGRAEKGGTQRRGRH